MAKKSNTENPNLESRVNILEKRVAKLETQLEKKLNRRKREYTDEERAAVRARLLAGQEAARKKREAEAKATKTVEVGKQERATLASESDSGSVI